MSLPLQLLEPIGPLRCTRKFVYPRASEKLFQLATVAVMRYHGGIKQQMFAQNSVDEDWDQGIAGFVSSVASLWTCGGQPFDVSIWLFLCLSESLLMDTLRLDSVQFIQSVPL